MYHCQRDNISNTRYQHQNKYEDRGYGKGVIILPDTGNDITEKEVLKALGISKTSNGRYTSIKVNTSGQPQEIEKTRVDVHWDGIIKKWLLTPEQLRLLQALDNEGFLDPELNYSISETDYEEV